MRAIRLERDSLQYCPDATPPTPGPDEVLVDVSSAGICETDLQLEAGYMGFCGVPGHEFVGVARSGDFAGKKVVGEINCNCHDCPRCRTGLGNHCGRRTVIGIDRHDGAFAEQVAVPTANLHAVPDAMSDDQAVLVEPVAAAFQILRQVSFAPDDRVAILGDGRLAYFCAQAITTAAPTVTVIGKHDSKLERFARRGLATSRLSQRPDDKTFDVVVDCTGSVSGMPLALELVRPRGTVVMKTTVASEHQLSLAQVVIDEITLVGSRCGPFDEAIRAISEGTVDVSGLITHRFALAEVEAAFAAARSPESFKVVFDL